MDKISTASDLSAKLKAKTEQDSSQQRALILREQEKLLNDLNRTLTQGLNTTLNDIRESLKNRLGNMAMLTASEAQTVETMVQEYQEKLKKLMVFMYSEAAKSIKEKTDPAAESLDMLSESLERATKAAEASAKASRRRWTVGALVGLTVFTIICASAWGLMQYLSNQVQQNLITIDAQEQTIRRLHDQTMGLQIIEAPNGMFLILPPGAQNGYSFGDKPAIKLPTN